VKPAVIRLLFLPREPFPTYRVDVDVLFGRQLLARGHAIDFVMQAANGEVPTGRQSWNGRTVWVGPTDAGKGFMSRLRKNCWGIWHDLAGLRHASPRRYDAVQVKDKFFVAIVALVLTRLRGMKFFFWLSFPIPESNLLLAQQGVARYPWISRTKGILTGWFLYRWILPYSDHVFVQSQRMKEDVCAKGADPAKVTPVPMGIDSGDVPSTAHIPRSSPNSGGGRTRLVYLGSLASERRLDILIDMLAELQRRGHEAFLLLVGDGDRPDDRRLLEDKAARLGVLDRLEITGFIPRSEALARVVEADVCLSPIYPTPILLPASPTKLVEYLALGIPVVANQHPEQRLMLRESRAGVCVPWGGRHFARAVEWLMKRSESERAAMGARGRAWVQQHRTYDRLADDLERTYLHLLAPRHDAGRSVQ